MFFLFCLCNDENCVLTEKSDNCVCDVPGAQGRHGSLRKRPESRSLEGIWHFHKLARLPPGDVVVYVSMYISNATSPVRSDSVLCVSDGYTTDTVTGVTPLFIHERMAPTIHRSITYKRLLP